MFSNKQITLFIAFDSLLLFNGLMNIREVRRKHLIQAIADHGSIDRLARATGCSSAHISQIKNKHRNMGDKIAERMELALGLPPGSWDRTPPGIQNKNAHYNLAETKAIQGVVPLISFVQAGQWSEIVDNFAPGDAEEWRETTAKVGSRAFALRVVGDSMTAPTGLSIPDGSVVIVDPDIEPVNGSIVVAKLTDTQEATLKRLVIDPPHRYLKALNPAYPMLQVNGNCSIVGVAKKVEIDI